MKKILILIFTVFLISFISADVCCEKTSNEWCVDTDDNNECADGFDVSPKPCEDTGFCETGLCFNPDDGICSGGSPEGRCNGTKQWSSNPNFNQCIEGCCKLGANTDFVTEKTCEIFSSQQGFQMDFDRSIPERECRYYSAEQGSCVRQGRCVWTTEAECRPDDSTVFFYPRQLCSNEELEQEYDYDYTPGFTLGCDPEEKSIDVFQFDDQENKEGISKTCIRGKTKCALVEENYDCKNIECRDNKNNLRKNGESWCLFDKYTGDSLDTAGSVHFVLQCNEGKIEYLDHSEQRNKICEEKIGEFGYPEAKLRDNLGSECSRIDDVEGCRVHPDCRIQSINLGKYFKFDSCVAKYPESFDSYETREARCARASMNCRVSWDEPSTFHRQDCHENCDCEKPVFATQMNDLCISMGDCGSNYNYVENWTENINNGLYDAKPYCDEKGYCKESFDADEDMETFRTDSICSEYGRCINGVYYTYLFTTWGAYKSDIYEKINQENNATNRPQYLPSSSVRNLGYRSDLIRIGWIGDSFEEGGGHWFFGEGKEIHTVAFTCHPWEPPVGGEDCERCMKNPLIPCTPYRCERLGKSCKILEETFDTNKPICYNGYEDDIDSPIISFDHIEGGHSHDNEQLIPNTNIKGIKITGCIQKYFRVNFTITTNENTVCRLGTDNLQSFEYMSSDFISTERDEFYEPYGKTHNIENLPIEQDDNYRLFIKCRDIFDNYGQYIVDFCVNPQPDTTSARMTGAKPPSESFLRLGKTNKTIEIYLDEPAQCRYSHSPGTDYASMTGNMACNQNDDMPLRRFCQAFVEGLTEKENIIYIKCNNTAGLINEEDFTYTLFATENELQIISVSPQDGTIRRNPVTKESPINLEVTTSGGAYGGVANCSYKSDRGWRDDFTKTDSTTHKYTFTGFEEGVNEIEINCEDKAGNQANALVYITYDIDEEPPIVVRAFNSAGQLKIITNENAECYYNDYNRCNPFNFENATKMTTALSKEHFAEWNSLKTYYIKCKDAWENVNPGCAIIVKPSQ